MKVKRLATFLLCVVLLLSQSISAHAEVLPNVFQGDREGVSISPLWTNINDIQLDLYFESGDACCAGIINALYGTTKITATFTLERKTSSGWALEKSWHRSSSTNSLSFFGTDSVSSGYTYRLSVTANVTRNGVTETTNIAIDGYN